MGKVKKKDKTPSFRENVEELKVSYVADGIENCTFTLENCVSGSYENKHLPTEGAHFLTPKEVSLA